MPRNVAVVVPSKGDILSRQKTCVELCAPRQKSETRSITRLQRQLAPIFSARATGSSTRATCGLTASLQITTKDREQNANHMHAMHEEGHEHS